MSRDRNGVKVYLEVIRVFARHFPYRGALIIACLLLSGLMESLGVVTLLPVLNLTLGLEEDPSGIQKLFTGLFEAVGLTPGLGVLLTLIVVTLAVKAVAHVVALNYVGYSTAHIITDLRLRMLRGVMNAQWGYFIKQPVGRLSNAVGMEAQRASSTFMEAANATAAAIRTVLFLSIAFAVSWEICLAALIVGAIISLMLRLTIRHTRWAGWEQTQLSNKLLIRLADGFQGMKPLKAMAREGSLTPYLERATEGLKMAQRKIILNKLILKSAFEPLSALFMGLGVYGAVTFWEVNTPTLLLLAILFNRSVSSLGVLQGKFQTMLEMESALWSLEAAITQAVAEAEPATAGETASFKRAIEFRNVSFAFGDRLILADASFELPPQNFITIAGPSGAGKTTFVDLIIGLYRPQGGEIFLDGVPMSRIDLRSWRGRIGYVPQEMFLFNDSVRANLTLGDGSISDAAVERALRDAEAWTFVQALPAGLDTVLGERGALLSGGQRQRIAIARALLGEPDLLILDEATTALDPATERSIAQTLRGLADRVTVLAITHQDELTRYADLVLNLVRGEVRLEAASRLPIAES